MGGPQSTGRSKVLLQLQNIFIYFRIKYNIINCIFFQNFYFWILTSPACYFVLKTIKILAQSWIWRPKWYPSCTPYLPLSKFVYYFQSLFNNTPTDLRVLSNYFAGTFHHEFLSMRHILLYLFPISFIPFLLIFFQLIIQ